MDNGHTSENNYFLFFLEFVFDQFDFTIICKQHTIYTKMWEKRKQLRKQRKLNQLQLINEWKKFTNDNTKYLQENTI